MTYVLSDFPVGAGFEIRAEDGGVLPLSVDKAEALPESGREGGSFRLEFVAPPDPLLPQATYRLHRDGREFDVFIVPVARGDSGARYEAIFF